MNLGWYKTSRGRAERDWTDVALMIIAGLSCVLLALLIVSWIILLFVI